MRKILIFTVFTVVFSLSNNLFAEEAVYRIIYGSSEEYKDTKGNIWRPFKINQSVDRGDIEIKNTDDARIYQTEVYGPMINRFKVQNGKYRILFHFAETYKDIDSIGKRVFEVYTEGKMIFPGLDVYKETGGRNSVLIKEVTGIDVKDESLEIEFVDIVEDPVINGIEIYRLTE